MKNSITLIKDTFQAIGILLLCVALLLVMSFIVGMIAPGVLESQSEFPLQY